MTKKALITGLTGQDGSYLAELLLEKGYEVFGLVRRSSSGNVGRIGHLSDQVQIVSGDLLDQFSLMDAIAALNRMRFIILLPRAMSQFLGRNPPSPLSIRRLGFPDF